MQDHQSPLISKSRRVYRNPYAHIEVLESEGASDAEQTLFTDARPSPSPGIFHNPWAFAQDEPEQDQLEIASTHTPTDANTPPFLGLAAGQITKKDQYSNEEIQIAAKTLHRIVWKNRHKIWGNNVPPDPVDMLDPKVFAALLGYEYKEESGVGRYQSQAGDVEVAGMIDSGAKTIVISHQFGLRERRFTAAHEIGHAALHSFQGTVHRDRPDDWKKAQREPREAEADKFATYLLMPENLVRQRFIELFGTDRFRITEETAFALNGANSQALRKLCPTRRKLAQLLAKTERYNFQHFNSLAKQFHVSVEAMAIRLEELMLV